MWIRAMVLTVVVSGLAGCGGGDGGFDEDAVRERIATLRLTAVPPDEVVDVVRDFCTGGDLSADRIAVRMTITDGNEDGVELIRAGCPDRFDFSELGLSD